jgi:RNA polymerase sigma factor (sigma-70 family)
VSATLGLARTRVPESAAATTRRLYGAYGQRVLTFCLSRLGDREDAQDAAQTTFVYVLRALERGVVPRHELAWLLKIAENVCHSSRRSRGRRMAVTSSADVTALEAAVESLSPETSEQIRELRAALALLPESQRRAVLLREWQGLSYAEIADELALSVPAVEALLFRARRGLAAQLQRTRGRLIDLGSSLAALRSLVQGGPAKMAVVTTVAGMAATPGLVQKDGRGAVGARQAKPAARAAVVAAAHTAPRRVAGPARSSRRSTPARAEAAAAAPKARSAPEAPVRASAPSTAPAAASDTNAPPADTAPSPPAPAAPAPAPVTAPVPAVQPVAEQVTAAVAPVAAAAAPVTATLPVPPPPDLPIK